MHILVTSGSGANGYGYGTILGFGPEGGFAGPFTSDPRIADPRGLSVDPSGELPGLTMWALENGESMSARRAQPGQAQARRGHAPPIGPSEGG